MLQPYSQAIERLFFVDAKGSGLIMYRERVGQSLSTLKTLIPGKQTDAMRTANADLLQYNGAQILATDTGVMWEVVNGAWSNSIGGVQQLEENCYISGTVGGTNTLRAVIGFAYTGNPAYQWTRDGQNIAGATAVTYVQDPLVDGQRDIGCVITGISAKYVTAKIRIPGVAPVSLLGIALTSGTTTGYAGFTVTAQLGLAPYTYSLVGAPSGMSVDSSGNVSYSNPQIGTYNGVQVVATDSLGGTASITFNISITQGGFAPVNTLAPVVSGTAQVGQTLSVTNGQWTGSPNSYAYVWKANGSVINGAPNQNTFAVQQAQLNQVISCEVSASNATGTTAQISNSTSAVIAATQASTKPRFGYAPANAAGDASIFDTLFPTMTELSGSANGGRAGTFNTVSSSTNYVWLAVLASAVGSGVHIFDGSGFGGFDGANSAGNFTGLDADPMVIFKQYTTGGNVWNLYRSDYKASDFGPLTLS